MEQNIIVNSEFLTEKKKTEQFCTSFSLENISYECFFVRCAIYI